MGDVRAVNFIAFLRYGRKTKNTVWATNQQIKNVRSSHKKNHEITLSLIV